MRVLVAHWLRNSLRIWDQLVKCFIKKMLKMSTKLEILTLIVASIVVLVEVVASTVVLIEASVVAVSLVVKVMAVIVVTVVVAIEIMLKVTVVFGVMMSRQSKVLYVKVLSGTGYPHGRSVYTSHLHYPPHTFTLSLPLYFCPHLPLSFTISLSPQYHSPSYFLLLSHIHSLHPLTHSSQLTLTHLFTHDHIHLPLITYTISLLSHTLSHIHSLSLYLYLTRWTIVIHSESID